MIDMTNMKPISFTTEMVQAILAGRKSQTRRVIKPQPSQSVAELFNAALPVINKNILMPRYQPGDILYVKETWQYIEGASGAGFAYKAGGGVHNDTDKWRSSRYMPKTAARLFLKVKDIRIERLQEITAEDCIAEGIETDALNSRQLRAVRVNCPLYLRHWYRLLWDYLNAKQGFGWNTNPWVWVIEFERYYPEVQQ